MNSYIGRYLPELSDDLVKHYGYTRALRIAQAKVWRKDMTEEQRSNWSHIQRSISGD